MWLAPQAVDHHHHEIKVIGRDTVSRDATTGLPQRGEQGAVLSDGSPALRGSTGRGILGWDGTSNMLGWDSPWRDGFRNLLVHPRIVGILNALLGQGFRLDHGMGLITMEDGAEGQVLHGSSGPDFNPHEYYVFRNGQLHNGLVAVMWQLADVPAGSGGFCIVPGTHKANLPLPEAMRLGLAHNEHVRQLEMRAGDVVIFVSAPFSFISVGTLP